MLKTNQERLICQSVVGEITSPQGSINPYRINPEGHSDIYPGVGGISYNLRIGDPARGMPPASPLQDEGSRPARSVVTRPAALRRQEPSPGATEWRRPGRPVGRSRRRPQGARQHAGRREHGRRGVPEGEIIRVGRSDPLVIADKTVSAAVKGQVK